ncbi:MAG: filamentous hemagglutinin, partial [Rhizonema sp. PD38]|nr:filamentous hemagglutinin [Rhizonema sp. PD38]
QRGEGSTFAITGRGGIPSSPNQTIASDNVRVGLVTPVLSRGTATTTANLPSIKPTIKKAVPVQGWVFNDKGQVVLTAYDPMKTGSQRPWRKPASCAKQ